MSGPKTSCGWRGLESLGTRRCPSENGGVTNTISRALLRQAYNYCGFVCSFYRLLLLLLFLQPLQVGSHLLINLCDITPYDVPSECTFREVLYRTSTLR